MRKLGIFCILSIVSSSAWAASPSPEQIRQAAAKGLGLLLTTQTKWTQGCYSCHQQTLPAFAVRAAREHGVPFDEAALRASVARDLAWLADLDRAVQYTHEIDAPLDTGQNLVAAEASGVRPSITTAIYARLVAARQKADGHWDTIDQRPPQSYSAITATAMAIRAIQLYGHKNLAADTRARVERARAWLTTATITPGVTEERSMQVFGLQSSGADAAAIKPFADKLRAMQRPDGGWASREGLESEAFSTGEALVALHDAGGMTTQDAAFQKGIQFLLSKQAADGSWHVVSRLRPPAPVSPPYFETGYPGGHDQFVSAMGAAWAVRALSAALGAPRKVEVPDVKEAIPTSVEPWVETAMFGSVAELKSLLDKGLSANAATRNGTTVLMVAQPDLEKTKLLLAKGANVNGRSKSKYSALIVAARYPDANPTINLLLDKGATVSLPKGQGTPLFNGTALMAATQSRNAAIIPRLCKAGENPNAKTTILGIFPQSPLLTTISNDGAETAKALLDCGAKVNETDDDGITPIEFAAIGTDVAVAKLLIERGADVNHVDKKGMTALLYAASVDLGDGEMIRLLLKAGANPAAKSKEGKTAAELAKNYRHPQAMKSLKTE